MVEEEVVPQESFSFDQSVSTTRFLKATGLDVSLTLEELAGTSSLSSSVDSEVNSAF